MTTPVLAPCERARVTDSTRNRNGHLDSPAGVVTTIVHEIDAPADGSPPQGSSARNANSRTPAVPSGPAAGTSRVAPGTIASGSPLARSPIRPASRSGAAPAGTNA